MLGESSRLLVLILPVVKMQVVQESGMRYVLILKLQSLLLDIYMYLSKDLHLKPHLHIICNCICIGPIQLQCESQSKIESFNLSKYKYYRDGIGMLMCSIEENPSSYIHIIMCTLNTDHINHIYR